MKLKLLDLFWFKTLVGGGHGSLGPPMATPLNQNQKNPKQLLTEMNHYLKQGRIDDPELEEMIIRFVQSYSIFKTIEL